MRALVVYDSIFGNTEAIARAIAVRLEATGPVRLSAVADTAPLNVAGVDLLVVGGPTHRHGVSEAMQTFLDRVPRGALRGMAAAAFDTRYSGARWLTGSAAVEIARALKKKGARLVAGPESFFMQQDVPPHGEKRRHERERLEPGEEDRAGAWAAAMAAEVEPATAVGVRR